jgi:hypothetical protein
MIKQTDIATERRMQKEALRATVRAIQERNANLPGDEIQTLIDEACTAVRAKWRKVSYRRRQTY